MSKLKDLAGRLFGFLHVQKRVSNYVQENGRTRTRWLCLCLLCGNAYIADGSHLLHGDIISCGCLKNIKAAQRMFATKGKIKSNSRTKNLVGKIINDNIQVLKIVESKNGKRTYLCKCLLCNNLFEARANHLLRGLIRSCGCVLSFAERHIRVLLTNKNINFKAHFWFDNLRGKNNHPYQFDFGILDDTNKLLALIEYQGQQHDKELINKRQYKEFGKQQREVTDDIKRNYCKLNNIPLFEIWYYQNLEVELDKILNEILHVNSVPSLN